MINNEVHPAFPPDLFRIHTNFIFEDTALILCLSCRKITLFPCRYILNKMIKLYNYPFSAPFDIFCQQEVNWIYNQVPNAQQVAC